MPFDVQPSELEKLVCENLRKRRRELGLTQEALANRIGASGPYISDLEHGKKTPTIGTLARLADALGTSPDALLTPGIFSSVR